MVNNISLDRFAPVRRVVAAYVVVALGTVAALIPLTIAAPRLATDEAWGHAVIVGAFSIVLFFRARAARKGSATGLRAVAIIGCVLFVVNLVEAALPGVFPSWMRVEMLVIAALMLALVVLAARVRRAR
jgi:peptidoglycan/LPS O-acetylase OafA/YrhL